MDIPKKYHPDSWRSEEGNLGEDNVVFRWFSEKDDETNTKDRVRLEQCDGSSTCPRIYSLQEDNHRLGIYGSDTDDQKYYICQAVLMVNGTLRLHLGILESLTLAKLTFKCVTKHSYYIHIRLQKKRLCKKKKTTTASLELLVDLSCKGVDKTRHNKHFVKFKEG